MGRGCISPRILYVCTTFWCVISYLIHALYYQVYSPHTVHIEVVARGSLKALCSWWQNSQLRMKYLLRITNPRALILQALLCILVNNIAVVGVWVTAFNTSSYGQPELGQFLIINFSWEATRWRSLLRYCVTSPKVSGSIPNCVTEIFYWPNPPGCTLALGLIQL